MAKGLTFRERVAVLMLRRDMSQRQLAPLIGMHYNSLGSKLKGEYPWAPGEREALAAALGTSLDARGLPRLDSNQQPVDYRLAA